MKKEYKVAPTEKLLTAADKVSYLLDDTFTPDERCAVLAKVLTQAMAFAVGYAPKNVLLVIDIENGSRLHCNVAIPEPNYDIVE